MIDITVNIEPLIRGGINQATGELGSYRLEGFEGSITIVPQQPLMGLPNLLEWRHIQGKTMKEVAERQLVMLNKLKADIDKMIVMIEKPLNKGHRSKRIKQRIIK